MTALIAADRDPVPPGQFLKSVKLTRWSRHDRLLRQEPLDVHGQTADRFVTSGAVFFQALHHHPVQIAPKQTD